MPLDAVSKQDAEEKNTDLASKAGAAKAAQANLDRLLAMKEFAQITAPFDGVVTKRTIDIGALVSAGPASSGDPLFTVSDIHVLRVYVNVPQSYSAQIVPGMTVTLTVPEYPGKTFSAKLVSTSNAISAQSSTLLVEFEADNARDLLKPGDYAQVSMALPNGRAHLRLPASALMFRADGLQVATCGREQPRGDEADHHRDRSGHQVVVASGLVAQGPGGGQSAGFAGQWRSGAGGRRAMRTSAVLAGCLLLSACNLAPDYKVPADARSRPPSRKPDPGFRARRMSALPREAWWTLYDDAP